MSVRTRACLFSVMALVHLPLWVGAQNSFSVIALPDPQYYSTRPSFGIYRKQAEWIVNQAEALNIKHSLWLGDLTNNNRLLEWDVAIDAYNHLSNAGIPYAVIPGNHDYCTNLSNKWTGVNFRNLAYYNSYLGASKFANKSWYGGNLNGLNENNYTYFSSHGMDFLVVGLEFGPRKEVLTWANNLIQQHPNHRVIVITHSYLTTSGSYGANPGGSYCGMVGAAGVNIWEECIKRHSNIFMVLSGHVTESHTNTKTGLNGNTIYEMLIDYQGEKPLGAGSDLGNGWLRVLNFIPSQNRINASTLTVANTDTSIFSSSVPGGPLNVKFYATSRYHEFASETDHTFSLNYNMTSPMEPYSYINNSLTFHTSGMGMDLYSDQRKPAIGQASNGDWALVWQDEKYSNEINNIMVRGFDHDGNERFARTIVNPDGQFSVNAINPSIAMVPDGRFIVVWQETDKRILARTFDSNGVPVSGNAMVVATATGSGSVRNPDIATDGSGNYVVVWEDDTDGDLVYDIKDAGFTFAGGIRFSAKTVNTYLPGNQLKPSITMNTIGQYVIAWEDYRSDTHGDVEFRGFHANGIERLAQQKVAGAAPGVQITPDVAMNDAGEFVIIWGDDADLNGAFQVNAQGFNANGTERFANRSVNASSTRNQINPSVDIDNNGNWYPVWEDNGISAAANGYQIASNVLDRNNVRLSSSDQQVNPVAAVTAGFAPPVRMKPVVSAHKSGRHIVAWADDMDGNGNFQVLAQGREGKAVSLAVKSPNGTVARFPADPFFAPNTNVTLNATPNSGYVFSGWTGDLPSGANSANPVLTINMNTHKSVTARFTRASQVEDWRTFE